MTPRRSADAVATLTQRVHGRGTLSRGDTSVDVAFSLEGSIYRPGEPWQLVAYGPAYEAPEWEPLLRVGEGTLALEGFTDDRRSIRLKEMRWNHHAGHRLTAEIHDVHYDCEAAAFVPTEQHVTVYLTQTPLARPDPDFLVRHWNGELSVPSGVKRDELPAEVIQTDVGDARFQLTYDWHNTDVEGATGDLRVPVPTLMITVGPYHLSAEPSALLAAVDAAVSDLLDVVSLLSRRFVRWTRMTLTTRAEGDGIVQGQAQSEWVRTVAPASQRKSRRDGLVIAGRLPADALQRLLRAYGVHPKKHVVRAAITYCLAAQDTPYLDASFTSAFTATETLLAAAVDAPPNPAAAVALDYRELRRRIAAAITAYTEEQGFSEDVAELLTQRVGNLTGLSTADRVCDLVSASGVRWDDLWPSGTPLDVAIRRAFRRRNDFFHRGQFPEPQQAHVDARRLSILCERLLFALVGGDEDWLSRWAYDSAGWLAANPA